MIDLTTLFCTVHDFWKKFEPIWNVSIIGSPPKRLPSLCMSEVMAILILFHASGYREFKRFYLYEICVHLKKEFPKAPSYTQFLALQKRSIMPMFCFCNSLKGNCSGISFIDSTSLEVCHIKRALSNRVFKGIARKGKTTKGWFYGLKLHLVINEYGELLSWVLTPGNVNDRTPIFDLLKGLYGKLFGDRGYISQELMDQLFDLGIQLITKIKKNMKNKFMCMIDKVLLKKRGLVDSVIGQLKHISQIEHTRHRSPVNCIVNLIGGLIAYSLRHKKPSLKLRKPERKLLKAC